MKPEMSTACVSDAACDVEHLLAAAKTYIQHQRSLAAGRPSPQQGTPRTIIRYAPVTPPEEIYYTALTLQNSALDAHTALRTMNLLHTAHTCDIDDACVMFAAIINAYDTMERFTPTHLLEVSPQH